MRLASSVLRIAVAAVSFCYMLLLLPHLVSGGFQPASLRYVTYDAALVVAFGWLPIAILHLKADRIEPRRLVILSLLPALLVSGFFALLFAWA